MNRQEARALLLRTGTWALQWQVPWARLKDVQLQPDRGRVLLVLAPEDGSLFGGGTRYVDCAQRVAGSPHRSNSRAALALVYETLQARRREVAAAQLGSSLASSHF